MEHQLTIYNTLDRKKELFVPLHAPHVGMYVCGPTVYGDAHLGHARPAITFDLLFRYLTHLGYKVRYVRNITDVGHLEHDADDGEDKIAKKARLEQLEPMEVAQYYINRYHKAMEALNVLSPSIEPHASGHIIEQIELVKEILKNGYAYVSEGSVYFDVEKYNKDHNYGVLSGRNIDDMRLGAGRHHHKFGNILFIGNRRECLPLRRLHHALRVRNAGAHFEKHRRVKFFGYLIRQLCERQRFRRVRRLKHRQFCRNGVMARILLVLRRVHTCVVRHADDKSAAHTGIGQRKQRVCRNVQADVLHAAEAAVACQTCAERSLHRYLFVRRPFCVNFRIFGSAFRDLRAGCAGIAGDKAASGLVQAARGSLVAEHQGFHLDSSCSRLSRMKIIIIF